MLRRSAMCLCLFSACTPGTQVQPPATKPSVKTSVTATPTQLAAASCKPARTWAPASTSDDEAASDRHRAPSTPAELCETADSNLSRSAREILSAKHEQGAVLPSRPWDKKTAPAHMARVAERLSLTLGERAKLSSNGFVVLRRASYSSYASALHEIYQSELPLYVSVDAVLHAFYASNDVIVAQLERERLLPLVDSVLAQMHCTLAASASEYPDDAARGADVYLSVARSLLAGAIVPSVFGVDAEVAALVADARSADGMPAVELFGRRRVVDFSQFKPRSHYAPGEDGDETLANYFRAVTWMMRLEFNLVSRSSRSSQPGATPNPEETPLETNVALVLSDVTSKSDAAAKNLQLLDRAFSLLAGKREDVSLPALVGLAKRGGIARIDADAPAKIRAAIGDGYRRKVRMHYMPEGSTELPAIATLLGPRAVADAEAIRPLVNGDTPGRNMVHAADVGYLLGHDRARTFLAEDLAKYPALGTQLDRAREIMRGGVSEDNLYAAWMGAVAQLGKPAPGAVPSFMGTDAFRDLRVSQAVVGYGQVRHTFALLAAQPYSEGGCEIPDGFVDPVPETYAALARYADRAADVFGEIAAPASAGRDPLRPYFRGVSNVFRVLEVIARDELQGRALSTEEKRFLSMVAEMTPETTGSPPTYTGWYFDLFPGRWKEALATPSFVSDYFTSGELAQVAYVGAQDPRLGVFVVDTGGPARLVVGPVSRGFELVGPASARYTDQSVRTPADGSSTEPAVTLQEPWAASYTVPSLPASRVAAFLSVGEKTIDVKARSTPGLSAVLVELLDHHRRIVATRSVVLPKGQIIALHIPKPTAEVTALRLRVGQWSHVEYVGLVGQDASMADGGEEQIPYLP